MATYIANHMIRHNGRLYQKGEEINTLSNDDAQELLKHRAITQFGKPAQASEPVVTPAKTKRRAARISDKAAGQATVAEESSDSETPAEPGGV